MTIVVLPTPRSAGDDGDLRGERRAYRIGLAGRQGKPGLALHPGQGLARVDVRPWEIAGRDPQKTPGNRAFGPVQAAEEYAGDLPHRVGNHRALRTAPGPARRGSARREPPGVWPRAVRALLPAGRNGLRPSLRSGRSRWPARTRTMAVFAMPSFIAMASAVTKPMPRMSRARRYGFSVMTSTASAP